MKHYLLWVRLDATRELDAGELLNAIKRGMGLELNTSVENDSIVVGIEVECICNGGEQGDGLSSLPHEAHCPKGAQ